MSGSNPGGPNGPPPSGGAPDPSMEDILASIRRILSEDETAPPPGAAPPPDDTDVLTLDASMLVTEPPHPEPPPGQPPPPARPEPEPPAPAPPPMPPPPMAPSPMAVEPAPAGLMAPEPVAAAAFSVGSLVRTLAEHQSLAVYRGGPTLEDIVREEMRPMLKGWLDENLPPLVERLVRAEIDRVVGRAVS